MLVRQCNVGMVMTNCFFIINEETKEVALVDPGDQARRLLDQCRQLGLTLKAILLTHGHFDHIMAVPALKEATGATVYASKAEDALLMDAEYNLSGSWQHRPLTVKADVLLQDVLPDWWDTWEQEIDRVLAPLLPHTRAYMKKQILEYHQMEETCAQMGQRLPQR